VAAASTVRLLHVCRSHVWEIGVAARRLRDDAAESEHGKAAVLHLLLLHLVFLSRSRAIKEAERVEAEVSLQRGCTSGAERGTEREQAGRLNETAARRQ